jgi:hypothetical protein
MTDQNPTTEVSTIPEHNPHMASQEWLMEGIRKAKAEDYKKIDDAKHAMSLRIAEYLHRSEEEVWDLTFKKPLSEMQRDYDILRYYIPIQETPPPSLTANNVVPRNYNVGLNVGVAAVLVGTGAGLYMVLTTANFTATAQTMQILQDMVIALFGVVFLFAVSVAVIGGIRVVRHLVDQLHHERSQNATALKLGGIFRRRNKQ